MNLSTTKLSRGDNGAIISASLISCRLNGRHGSSALQWAQGAAWGLKTRQSQAGIRPRWRDTGRLLAGRAAKLPGTIQLFFFWRAASTSPRCNFVISHSFSPFPGRRKPFRLGESLFYRFIVPH